MYRATGGTFVDGDNREHATAVASLEDVVGRVDPILLPLKLGLILRVTAQFHAAAQTGRLRVHGGVVKVIICPDSTSKWKAPRFFLYSGSCEAYGGLVRHREADVVGKF